MMIEKRESNPDELRHQIQQLMQSNRLADAQVKLEALIAAVPNDVPACMALSNILYELGHVRDSSEPLLQASKYPPANGPMLVDLIQHLVDRGEIVAARTCLDFLAQAPGAPPEWLMTQARLRFSLGEVVVAKRLVEKALAAGADQPDDHYMLGRLQQFTGDIEGACATHQRCLDRWPAMGKTILPLVSMLDRTSVSEYLDFIENQLQSMPENRDDREDILNRAHFELARFTILDRSKRHVEAWPSLVRCKAMLNTLNPYDAATESAVVDDLIAASRPAAVHQDHLTPGTSDAPIPIFIVGFTRSGTSLLDRMLSNHSEVATAGELIEFFRQLHWTANLSADGFDSMRRIIRQGDSLDFQMVGRRYLEQTRWHAAGHRYYIDKMPANFRMVDFIRRALPQARILYMVRDAMDVCYSNFKAFFGIDMGAHSNDMLAMAHYYKNHTRLRDHWRKVMPGAMLDVSYAELTRDPEGTMRTVLEYCGLEFEEACVRPETNTSPMATPSSAQLNEPIHTRSIGEWKNYAEQLEPLRRALA